MNHFSRFAMILAFWPADTVIRDRDSWFVVELPLVENFDFGWEVASGSQWSKLSTSDREGDYWLVTLQRWEKGCNNNTSHVDKIGITVRVPLAVRLRRLRRRVEHNIKFISIMNLGMDINIALRLSKGDEWWLGDRRWFLKMKSDGVQTTA